MHCRENQFGLAVGKVMKVLHAHPNELDFFFVPIGDTMAIVLKKVGRLS